MKGISTELDPVIPEEITGSNHDYVRETKLNRKEHLIYSTYARLKCFRLVTGM